MKGPNCVLLGIALILFAGVIVYNTITVDVNTQNSLTEDTSNTTISNANDISTTVTEQVTYTSSKININKASAEELDSLKGIGPSKAEAIVEYREQHGNFNSVEEITNVSGIGEKTLANIIDNISVE